MKNSSIVKIKSKFFLYRALTYFTFLLIPIWVQKSVHMNQALQGLMMCLYILFMVSQWFLLGKEIDHRLKIYFRVNSSMDRVIYRLILGMVTMVVYFSLLGLLPQEILKHFFWGTWIVLGIFYSWPTRGKIIQETVSSQMGEFKYLDSFEKTILGLTALLFLISVPTFPSLESTEALKLFFDPLEKISPAIWNFLSINYFPFKKFPHIFRLAWCLHFYLIGMGIYLLAFYALLRYFVSRRLSVLGVFALISSWSYSKILEHHLALSLTTTFSVVWIWSLLWISKSSTYRSGLFLGILGYWGTMINQSYILLIPIQLGILYFFYLKEKTHWYKRQVVKYSLLGFGLSALTFIMNMDSLTSMSSLELHVFWRQILSILDRKGFFILSILGFLLICLNLLNKKNKFLPSIHNISERMFELFFGLGILFLYSILIDSNLFMFFSAMWIVALLSLIPLEWIFQSISRLRSRRNLIYAIYILICLLDSHIEGRIKIFIKLFS